MINLYKGFVFNLRGAIFAFKHPKLLILGLMRFLVVLVLTVLISGLVLYWHENIVNLIWKMPDSGWLVYIWKAVSWILTLGLLVLAMVISYLCAQILFGVFIMDYMSKITEKIITGSESGPDSGSVFFFFIHLVKQEIPRAVIPVLISFVIMAAGLFTPAGPVIIVLSSLCAAVFLAWDNTDLIPARQLVPFRKRFGFLKHNLMFHLGFGVLFLIPWLNMIFLSFAPVGATLYYLEMNKKIR
jgi:CysZ protein